MNDERFYFLNSTQHIFLPIKKYALRNSSLLIHHSSLKVFFFSILIFSNINCTAQVNSSPSDTSAYTLLKKIDVNARLIAMDKIQQLYVITHQNEVIKYSPEGKELFRFTNNTLGDLTHMDVTNPFSILLYYPDFMMVYTLDRTLNQTGEFNLFDLNVTDVETVAMSNDNNVWLYDDPFFKIKKVNRSGDVLRESLNLSNQFEKPLRPNFILERENWLYVNDPEQGILVFDIFGQFVKIHEVKNLTSFQIMGNQLIYQEAHELKSFHLKSLNTKIIDLPKGITEDHQMVIGKNKLFVRKKSVVEIFSF